MRSANDDDKIVATVNNTHLLEKPVNGEGGFQGLLRRLQGGYDPKTKVVVMHQKDQDRIIKAVESYGNGGWQDRLLKIFF